jgi:uncharacterized protein (DUF2147 family)
LALNTKKSNSLFLLVFLVFSAIAHAADNSAAGLWQSIDDKTGKPRSHIRVYNNSGEFSAVVEKGLLDTDTGDAVCSKCKDERKDKPIIGMTILDGMKQRGHVYEGGQILDPENGKIYRCKMKLDSTGNLLEVRGFIGISLFGRSQMWTRVE